jgi:hypothetical protein
LSRSARSLVAVSAALVTCVLSTSPASARDAPDDGVRFRGGIAGQLGPSVFTAEGQLAVASGLQGHVGVQVNRLVGIYWAPRVEVIAGEIGGPYVGSPFVVDFTIDDFVAFGLGPELGYYAQIVDAPRDEEAAARFERPAQVISSPQVGGLLRLAFYPERDAGPRRAGLMVGADLGIRATGTAGTGAGPDGPPLVLAPAFVIGHEAY